LDNSNEWCILNGHYININKSQSISFFKKHKPINFNYYLSGIKLYQSSLVKDLGILFDSKRTYFQLALTSNHKYFFY